MLFSVSRTKAHPSKRCLSPFPVSFSTCCLFSDEIKWGTVEKYVSQGGTAMVQTARVSLLGLVLMFVASLACSQEIAKPRTDVPLKDEDAARSELVGKNASPIEVYRAYLNAIKNNDVAAAKRCLAFSGKDADGILDFVVGMWIAPHRLNAAIRKAGLDGKQFGDWIFREDCTDEAIDRTLARLKHSTFTIKGDKAVLKIQWDKNDGYPNPAFLFCGDDPILFCKLPTGWKIGDNAMSDIEKPQDFFASSWVAAFRAQMKMSNEIAAGLESGKLKTAMDVVRALEKYTGSLEGRIPLTKTVVYLEDSPARYLQIKKGNPGVVSLGGTQLPHRKDIQFPRKIEGDLHTIFSEMHGRCHPKIVVETKNQKGYEVIYDTDDKQALQIVAKQLGMTVAQEEREIMALRITVAKGGHHLKKVEKPDEPQWDSCVCQGVWPLHGVTMDELALFLESRFCRPVVNKTGLKGYYRLELSDETVRLWPQEEGEKKALDKTGLQIHWEPTKTKVLVVKDKDN
ncbi:MAG: DUF3738 domain-containing protein [Planctomycetia bacterium]